MTLRDLYLLAFTFGAISLPMPSFAAEDWDYSGDSNTWADQSPAYSLCSKGINQSPINIDSSRTKPRSDETISTTWGTLQKVTLRLTPYRIVLDYGNAASKPLVRDASGEWALQAVEFRTPSEHSIDNQETALEVQFLFKNAHKQPWIIATMLRLGDSPAALESLINILPLKAAPKEMVQTVAVDLSSLLPLEKGWYSYEGSFTTPPCAEHVRWTILKAQPEITHAQLKRFAALVGRNSREVQPSAGRIITEISAAPPTLH